MIPRSDPALSAEEFLSKALEEMKTSPEAFTLRLVHRAKSQVEVKTHSLAGGYGFTASFGDLTGERGTEYFVVTFQRKAPAA